MWQWTFCNPARFAADETIFWRFLVESFPLLPEKRYSWSFSFSAWFCNSSFRNSGMLKVLSLFPFAWRMCPIFSGKLRSAIFKLLSSETRNPQAYIRLIMSFDFSVLISFRSFLISSLDNVDGRCCSFFGRLIVAVMSLFNIDLCANFIAARNRIIELADFFVRFSAMKSLMSSVVVSVGDFFVKSSSCWFAFR